MKIPYPDMIEVMRSRLLHKGFTEEKAKDCAELFAQASLDGVNSHGVNRFVLFNQIIDKGLIDVHAEPVKIKSNRALEQWDGQIGSGLNNAKFAMNRTIELARETGIACVALRNTNHWMRGGNYGLLAAEAGMLGICWSNTLPNMPVWGGAEPRTGNNPVIFALPGQPNPVLLDMSMSLFSYGKMETFTREGKQMPYECGFDKDGNLTRNPETVLETRLPLSMGYWKGAGLSIMLDLFASVLSEGLSSKGIGELDEETRLSQVFIAIDVQGILDKDRLQAIRDEIITHVLASGKMRASDNIRYPGQRGFQTRERQLREGVEVDDAVWQGILELPL